MRGCKHARVKPVPQLSTLTRVLIGATDQSKNQAFGLKPVLLSLSHARKMTVKNVRFVSGWIVPEPAPSVPILHFENLLGAVWTSLALSIRIYQEQIRTSIEL